DELLHSWHVDDDLDYSGGSPPDNRSRLLVHPPGSWAVRPEASTAVPNLVLAGDYVRTSTDLASMEGASEAARRAVNTILRRSASASTPARLWDLVEPAGFDSWKALDERLYLGGNRHLFELMGIRRAAQAADLVRRFSELTGLSVVDDLIDEVRVTTVIARIMSRLGLQA
ncbi:MAG: FAD-dependent oxidoreductase, partial [Kofleriaceae bacterium]